MNLNPFHHLRKYRQQSQEIAQLKQFNSLVLNRNNELNQDLANERQALDQANAKIKNLENELNEIQSESKIISGKKLKKSANGNYYCPIHNVRVIPFITMNGFRKWRKPTNGCWCPPKRTSFP